MPRDPVAPRARSGSPPHMPHPASTLALASSLAVLAACAASPRGGHDGPPAARDAGVPAPDAPRASPCAASPGDTICLASVATTCTLDGLEGGRRDCASEGLDCAAGL